MTATASAPKTEQLKDAGPKAWWAKPRPEDAEMRRFAGADPMVSDGGRLTLGKHLHSVWEGLHAAGAAGCPVCGGRMERHGASASCAGCGSVLS